MISKKDLRQEYRRLLHSSKPSLPTSDQGDDAAVERASLGLNARLVDILKSQSGTWASFQPTGFEPDIRPAMKQLTNCQWVFPRVEGEHMSFYQPSEPAVWALNKWGILEPDPASSRRVDLAELEGLLIPGLAFDLNCNRLGRGGGFYDRSLAEIRETNPEAIKIGVALDRQISEDEIPTESFDVPMNWVVTESRTLQKRTTA